MSLVRNVKEDGQKGGIGFLKVSWKRTCYISSDSWSQSINRTNVALSRAKHGMIIMGNADLLSSRSEMWRTIIKDLSEAGRLGPGLPISCYNHPDYIKYITVPEMIPLVSPDGEVFLRSLRPIVDQWYRRMHQSMQKAPKLRT